MAYKLYKNIDEVDIGTWVGINGGWDTYPCIVIEKDKDRGIKICEALTEPLIDRIRFPIRQ
jgi:hypothetical protein